MTRIIFIFLLSLIYSIRSYILLGRDILANEFALIFIGINILSLIIILIKFIGKVKKEFAGRK